MSPPSTVNGFTVFPITCSSSATHCLYVRKHEGPKKTSSQRLPHDRTIFIVNVPPDATDRELTLLFKHCGTVERVIYDVDAEETQPEAEEESDEEMEAVEGGSDDEEEGGGVDSQPKRRQGANKSQPQPPKVVPLPAVNIRFLRPTGRTAHIVFLDASAVERAVAPQQKPRPWPSSSDLPPSGLARYQALYATLRPPLDVVREHADTSMEAYEYEQAKAKQKSKYHKGEAIVDEDGFTLVVRGGAYGQTLGGGVSVASKRFQATGETSARKRKEKKTTDNLYGFQKAEKQRKELIDLKKKWEEDKAKVEKLKASRRFRPY
ncbi:hypothetical protein BDN72DRAFT_827270 [Pluteus cervinus]|uniref:Uncharacterized protein n=1 Tax=Pluteus cervinus TaxID=181527 RepID=A0ACD3AAG2_9AGAR|nr:hypothetical protein BDN72DRAFT_827270 [Pluteus cervinus]